MVTERDRFVRGMRVGSVDTLEAADGGGGEALMICEPPFGFGGDDPTSFVNGCAGLHFPSQCRSALGEVVAGIYDLQVDADARETVLSGRWLLMHDHRLARINSQSEVGAAGGKEIHAPSHVFFSRAVECSVASMEKIVDSSCGETRRGLKPPAIEVSVGPAVDTNPGTSIGIAENMRPKRVGASTRPCSIPVVTADAAEIAPLFVTRAIIPSWS
nr:unnamed protein product [Spirometra erinaceieuropaei]